jgi:uncharacterized membrane protein
MAGRQPWEAERVHRFPILDAAREAGMSDRGKRSVVVAAAIIGIGLSGFFDGILLHQVLQWHHLLSLVPGEAFRDIGTQILADGLFHVLMYAVTLTGLWMLWRRRALLREGAAGWRTVVGGALLGFGLWNLIDVGFFHWILGIHRIRVDVPDPLAYDIGWLVLLGLVPGLLGWFLLRGGKEQGGGTPAATMLMLAALIAAPLAARPAPGSDGALILVTPGRMGMLLSAAVEAGAPVVWIDPRGRMIAVQLEQPGTTARLYRAGALLVGRSPSLAGCVASLRG